MNKFELSSAFLIGHEKIDSDHAGLVKILNDMVDSFVSSDVCSCRDVWLLFCTKLEQHFIDEVHIMNSFGFDEDGAEEEHQQILDHVNALGKNNTTIDDWEECLFEMRNHLLSWILKKDLLFAEYLITTGYNESYRKVSYL